MANNSKKRLWPDEDEWLDLLSPDPGGIIRLSTHVAHIWFSLLEHLSQGPEGIRDARLILKQALRLTYPFTSSSRLAYRHYKLRANAGICSEAVKPED